MVAALPRRALLRGSRRSSGALQFAARASTFTALTTLTTTTLPTIALTSLISSTTSTALAVLRAKFIASQLAIIVFVEFL